MSELQDLEVSELKKKDEDEEDNSEGSSVKEEAILVIKNSWKDLPDSAAYPAQLNMDECPPLRGFEGMYRNLPTVRNFENFCEFVRALPFLS
jgi:hypothetical protein